MVALSPPSFAVISSHSAAVEVSHQSLAGRMTSPFLSSGTKPCCWPLTPMALTSSPMALAWRSALANRLGRGVAPGMRMLFLRAGRQDRESDPYACAAEPRTLPLRASTTRTLVD